MLKLENKFMKFEYSDEYALKFGDFVESKIGKRLFANDLLKFWDDTVQQLESGWEDYYIEFDNDIFLRSIIETCIRSSELNALSEHKQFVTFISQLDSGFISGTQEHFWSISLEWWNKRLPKKVTKHFFIDEDGFRFFSEHGIGFDVVE
jgi:hypothetical protein